MFEDKQLIRQFKQGSEEAFSLIYEKYKDYLLTLSTALLNDISAAEDVVHSVFVGLAESIEDFELTGSLKKYLAICALNRARNVKKARRLSAFPISEAEHAACDSARPEHSAMLAEDSRRVNDALARLPYEQREVITLHLKGGMKFRQIASLQNESINTVQSRYRYGLEKLRSLLNEEPSK
ncbi:MAG: RNA polymerase sigma factor [Planctomycetota bacterium]|jgi:RNA polymerase sigma-70 factor (ECF subfamily)